MNALCKLLTLASERLAEADPGTQARLDKLAGKVFHLVIHAPDFSLFVVPTPRGLVFQSRSDRDADVILSGSFVAFAAYGLGGLGLRIESREPVSIQGDLELAQAFQQILAKVDIDREELLAGVIGDTPARKLNVTMTALTRMLGDSARLAQKNLSEYLQEEKQILASQPAMRRHIREVDALRSRLDRTELRAAALAQKLVADPD